MAPDTDRRSLRSLRSDRDDSKERGVAFYTFVSLRGHPGKTTLTMISSLPFDFALSKIFHGRTDFHPFWWTTGPSRLRTCLLDWLQLYWRIVSAVHADCNYREQFSRGLFSPCMAAFRPLSPSDGRKSLPQGLKPIIFCRRYGTTKVVP